MKAQELIEKAINGNLVSDDFNLLFDFDGTELLGAIEKASEILGRNLNPKGFGAEYTFMLDLIFANALKEIAQM